MTIEQMTNYLKGYGCTEVLAKRLAYDCVARKKISQKQAVKQAQLNAQLIDREIERGTTWKQ